MTFSLRPGASSLPLVLLVFVLSGGCGSLQPSSGSLPDDPTAAMLLPADYRYPADDTVTVVTWNVEHFVDSHDNPYIDNRREDDPSPQMQQRIPLFAEAIRKMDADVVVLQEIESAAFAELLADSLFPEMGYRFVDGTESPDWYQNVVVMSRLPLGVMRSYANVWTPLKGERDDQGRPLSRQLINNRIWMVEVLARPGYSFSLIGAHLKAGRDDYDVAWRSGQIRFLLTEVERLAGLRPEANVLLAGDLNAVPGSPELALLFEAEGEVLPFVDPNGDEVLLTHASDDPERQLDHILPSRTMMPEYVEGSLRVMRPLSRAGMAQVSDHLPVAASFVAR